MEAAKRRTSPVVCQYCQSDWRWEGCGVRVCSLRLSHETSTGALSWPAPGALSLILEV